MSNHRNLSNGTKNQILDIAQKKAYMKMIWSSVTPDNVFYTVDRVRKIGKGAKLKISEQVIINQLK